MNDDDLFPFARRAFGSALVTGASGASMALSFARPAVDETLEMAWRTADEMRRAARQGARTGFKDAIEAGRPTIEAALGTKDLMRRRAMGTLPPQMAERVEAWRSRGIDAEKLAYFASRRAARDLEPALELARARSRSVLAEAVHAFEDVAEVALSTSITFGDELARGDIAPPKRSRGAAAAGKKSSRARKGAKKTL